MTEASGETIPVIVDLTHTFFKPFANAYFRNTSPPEEKPVLVGLLGDQEVILPLSGIIRELNLEEATSERVMLETISKSLKFVNILRQGDKIPAEVITGEASWEPGPNHLEIARQRLTMQLVTWVSGRESLITDPMELQQLFDDPSTKQKVANAFKEASQRLGFDDPDQVPRIVESFAEELSYIEGLRARYVEVRSVYEKILRLRRKFHDQLGMIVEIDPILRLIKAPVEQFHQDFELIDAQTSEIMSVLSRVDVLRQYVRDARDDLYIRLLPWTDVVGPWREMDPDDPQAYSITNMLRDLYRFLAPRFMSADEWLLAGASGGDKGEDKKRVGGVMVW